MAALARWKAASATKKGLKDSRTLMDHRRTIRCLAMMMACWRTTTATWKRVRLAQETLELHRADRRLTNILAHWTAVTDARNRLEERALLASASRCLCHWRIARASAFLSL